MLVKLLKLADIPFKRIHNSLFYRANIKNISSSLERQRYGEEEELRLHLLRKYFSSKNIIHNSIFKGMKLPKSCLSSAAIISKILGSYESELIPIFQKIIRSKNCNTFINIGCAEGYYSVGLAMKKKYLKSYAYDILESERKKCLDLAKINNVEKNIKVASKFVSKDFFNFDPIKETLVLSDCEGYENELFSKKISNNFKNWHFLIEIHDFIEKDTSKHIKDVFKGTHDLVIINHVLDMKKALNTDFLEYQNKLDLMTKTLLIAERRPVLMHWFYFKPKL